MNHLGTLREYHFGAEIDDIRGASVYGPNLEVLGTIDDVIFDQESGKVRYAIIDTGGWLDSHKFVVPAEKIEPHTENPEEFLVELTREQITQLPAFHEDLIESEAEWREYEQKLRQTSGWTEPGATTHAIEVEALRSPTGTPPEIAGERTTAEVRRRWAIFQDSLRRNREKILARSSRRAEKKAS